jgi:ribosomal protein S18 acetylase RimI-like enzyme
MEPGVHDFTIRRLDAADARAAQYRLAVIFQDAVEHGASVGYLAPLATADALDYWAGVIAGVAAMQRILLVTEVEGEIAGTVQLVLEMRPNGDHRAEVSKMLVHTAYRRRGIGAALMRRVEVEAIAAGRTLLVLDTQTGEPAERLYERLGYVRTGVVPGYARFPDGRLGATTFMHKLLEPAG